MSDRLHRLADLLAPVKYRDVTFGVQDQDPYGLATVTLFRDVEDSHLSGVRQVFGCHVVVPPAILREGNEAEFYRWLFYKVVMDVERHEAAEWFLVDGERLFDPHKAAA